LVTGLWLALLVHGANCNGPWMHANGAWSDRIRENLFRGA